MNNDFPVKRRLTLRFENGKESVLLNIYYSLKHLELSCDYLAWAQNKVYYDITINT